MGFRFHKTIKLSTLLRLNLSKSGASVSAHHSGVTLNMGRQGTRTTVALPGTGLSYRSTPVGGMAVVGLLVVLLFAVIFGT